MAKNIANMIKMLTKFKKKKLYMQQKASQNLKVTTADLKAKCSKTLAKKLILAS